MNHLKHFLGFILKQRLVTRPVRYPLRQFYFGCSAFARSTSNERDIRNEAIVKRNFVSTWKTNISQSNEKKVLHIYIGKRPKTIMRMHSTVYSSVCPSVRLTIYFKLSLLVFRRSVLNGHRSLSIHIALAVSH